jgi:hypothetical protein
MDSRAFWLRLKTHGWVYSFSIAATLALGILIGTVVSYGVKGKEGQKSSDATPLTVPSPKQLSNDSRRSPSSWGRAWSTSIPSRP